MVSKRVFTPKLVIGLLLTVFFGVAVFFRISLPYHDIFVGDWIKLSSNDAYYYMRLVDNLVHNFPFLTHFDPFSLYPGGIGVGGISFIDWLLALVIWIVGLGSPTQHTIDVVGVYFPAIIASLTVIPVYFIGKALFNRWAGVLAAGLMAVLPGEFLGRSILGAGDTPFAETFLTATALAFFIMAIKTARERQLTFSHFFKRDWKVITRPLVYSVLAGLFLGLYLNTWHGGMLFVFIIALYLVIQFIINHLRHQSADYLGIAVFVTFLVALICFLPVAPTRDLAIGMVVALLIPLVLSGISLLMIRKGIKPYYYPLSLVVIGAVFVGIFYAVSPGIINGIFNKFAFVFFPSGSTATTTLEMQPFLSPQGSFSTIVPWGNFTTSFFLTQSWAIPGLAFISLFVLIYLFLKHRGKEEHWLFFFIWTLIILIVTLVQRRFAYYFVVNVAILSGFLSWQVIWLAGLKKLTARPEEIPPKSGAAISKDEKSKKHSKKRGLTLYHVNVSLMIILVFFSVYFFNIMKSKDVASQASYAPSDGWQSSLLWMKDNTPEPLGDPDAYYKIYEAPPVGENFTYPESAYGVTSWWDYGYWISRIAHRLPSANPAQDPERLTKVAKLLLSQDEALTQEIMKELDSSYLIVDYSMPISKFWAIVDWSGLSPGEFTSVYYVPNQGQLVPAQVYNQAYYQTLLVRLYNFNGQPVTNENPVVVAYEEKTDSYGNHYKQATDINEFNSYQEAVDYINSQESGKYDIVGVDPFISPVRLEAMGDYRLEHSSEYSIQQSDNFTIPEVKIFKYLEN